MEVLWFIPGHGDNRYLGTQEHRRLTSHTYLSAVAKTIDGLGFTGALLPTGAGCEDSWVLASTLIPETKRMKFLIAMRPGSISPTLAARMAATFDRLSNGRLLINIITGGDPVELAGDGTFLTHDERYEVTDEFCEIYRQLFTGDSIDFEGKHLQIKGGKLLMPPVQRPYPPLFFGGSSPAGHNVAAKHANTYLTLAEPPAAIKAKIEDVRSRAAAYGRTVEVGLRVHVFVRERAEEAWEAAERTLRYATDDVIAERQAHLSRFDSHGQGRMVALHEAGRGRDTLEISPNLWAGPGLVNKGLGTALVGDADTLAERIQEYMDIGVDKFIMSSYPHLEEAYQVAELLLPRIPAWREAARQRDEVFHSDLIPQTWQ